MELVLGRGAFERERGAFPPWSQENVLLEQAKTDPKGFNILSRPPLVENVTRGLGPIRAIFQRPGLFNGDTFYVSDLTVYRAGVSVGTITGTGPVGIAGGNGEIVIAAGDDAYSYDGASLAAIVFPDGAKVRAVNWMARRFVFVRKGSGRFYWSDLDDGRTVDGLSFATAESEQDELYDIKKQGDVLALMGANSIESWVLTGDADLPWTRITQRTFGRGVRDTGCAEEIEGGVFFISNDQMVCALLDNTPRISDGALDEKIRQSATASTFWFQYEGKPLLCVRIDAGTYVLDLAMQNLPSLFSTQGRDNWAPLCAWDIDGDPLFGDDADGTVWAFDESASTDCGNAEHPRVFSAGLPLNGALTVGNLIVSGNNGSAQVLSGEAADPILEMRHSRDGGRTWSDWRGAHWGQMGQYKRRARFGTCGMFAPPGFLAEFRLLACAPMRVESVRANESLSGRGWR